MAAQIDTSVPTAKDDLPGAVPFLVFNPLPTDFSGHIELEASLDSRPLWQYEHRTAEVPLRFVGLAGQPLCHQTIALEANWHMYDHWRRRILVPVTIPALGWSVVELGYSEEATPNPWPQLPQRPAIYAHDGIENGAYRVLACIGDAGVRVLHDGREIFGPAGFSVQTFEDPWGAWGGLEKDRGCWDISTVRETWRVTDVRVLERGPWRASLWVRLAGRDGKSHLELTFNLYSDRAVVEVLARVHWNQPRERLKLVFPAGDEAEFEVPGATVTRTPRGDVPGQRWVRVLGAAGFGFVSDSLSGFDTRDGCLRASVVRTSHHAYYGKDTGESPWLAPIDSGELKFKFLLAPRDADLPALAQRLEHPPIALAVPARKGSLPPHRFALPTVTCESPGARA